MYTNIFVRKIGAQTLAIALTSGLMLVLCGLLHWRGQSVAKVSGGVNLLNADWDICTRVTALESQQQSCNWRRVSNKTDGLLNHYALDANLVPKYRVHFQTPQFCRETFRGCEVFVGGVYQSATARLNDHILGTHFTRTDLYPARFKIPSDSLRADGQSNELILELGPTESGAVPVFTQGPVGVYSSTTSDSLSESILGERIVLPLVCAMSCFTLGLIALFWMRSRNSPPLILNKYFGYCVAAGLYMLYASRVPREYSSENAGFGAHFTLRFAMELGIFELVSSYFLMSSKTISRMRWLYLTPILIFSAITLLLFLDPSCDRIVYSWTHFSWLPLSPRYGGAINLIACAFLPLTLVAPIVALWTSGRHVKQDPKLAVLLSLFLVLVPLKVADLLTFYGYIRTLHELYYTRLYTPFIAMAFGYAIWDRWLEREQQSEAALSLGRITSSVVHDLKSPIAALKVLRASQNGLDPDLTTLLDGAVEGIAKLTSELLNTYKFSFQNTQPTESSVRSALAEAMRLKSQTRGRSSRAPFRVLDQITTEESDIAQLDYYSLKRILDNLLDNALESCTQSEPSVQVSLKRAGPLIEIQIEDNGDGISESLLRAFNVGIFGKTSKQSGHGIGLQSCYKTLQSHGGKINFGHAATGGTVVTLFVPAK